MKSAFLLRKGFQPKKLSLVQPHNADKISKKGIEPCSRRRGGSRHLHCSNGSDLQVLCKHVSTASEESEENGIF
jgi:hypothetical protein